MFRSLFSLRRSLILLLALTSCTKKTEREWGLQTNVTACPRYNAGRIYLEPEKEYDYLEIEIIRSQTGIRFYINVLFLQAQPCVEDATKTKIEVIFEDEEEPWIVYGRILKGGQRILLPSDVTDYLIQSLLTGHSFDIHLGQYRIRAISNAFEKHYHELGRVIN